MVGSMGSKPGTIDLLRRNPAGGLVVLACGLLVAISQVPGTLVVANLAAAEWGEDMSRNMGFLDMARYAIAFFCTGPLGRFGDRYGSRAATAVVAVLLSLPAFMLLIFGESAWGITAWSVARVLTGITGATTSGAPALFSLLHEVVSPDDFEAFVGLGFAGSALLWMVGNLVGAAILRRSHSSRAVLIFVAGLSIILSALIAAIKVPRRESKMKASEEASPADPKQPQLQQQQQQQQEQHQQQQFSSHGSAYSTGGSDENDRNEAVSISTSSSSDSGSSDGSGGRDTASSKCALLASLQLALTSRALLKLCAIAALVSIPETVLFELLNQFSFENLGLMGAGASGEERSFVTFHNVMAIQMSLLLGSYAVGLLAQRLTSLRVMKWLIPTCAVLQSLPAVVRLAPEAWVVVLSAVALGLSLVVLPPLQALVPQFSPEGSVGEAMGTVGAVKCIASLLGNVVVSVGVPAIQSTGLEKPLWVFFPLFGLVSLSAFPLALLLPTSRAVKANTEREASVEEGAASLA